MKSNSHYYVEDLIRVRAGPGKVEELIYQTARMDGRNVRIHLPQDPGGVGKIALGQMVRMLAGWIVQSDRPTGDKVTRAMPFLAQAEHGNVSLARANWNTACLDEMCAFPVGKHDDQVDETADAFNELAAVLPPLQPIRVKWGRCPGCSLLALAAYNC